MTPTLTVRSLLDESAELRLVLLAGESGLGRRITIQRIQKPGLALAGFVRQVHPERVQILGATEISYLETLSEDAAPRSVEAFFTLNPACVVVTKGLEIPALLREAADRLGVPLLRTPLISSVAIDQIQKYLELQLAPDRQHPRGADGRAGRRRAAAGQERHRQVRGGAGPHHARAPSGRRRSGRGAPHARAASWSAGRRS